MKRQELRMPVLHQKLFVHQSLDDAKSRDGVVLHQKLFVHQSLDDAKSRDGVTNTVADSPSGECSAE